jgi:hypothetical protein
MDFFLPSFLNELSWAWDTVFRFVSTAVRVESTSLLALLPAPASGLLYYITWPGFSLCLLLSPLVSMVSMRWMGWVHALLTDQG